MPHKHKKPFVCMQLFDKNNLPPLDGSFNDPPEKPAEQTPTKISNPAVGGTMRNGARWPPGTVLRVGFLDGDSDWHDMVKEYCVEWCQYANVGFDFPPSGPYEIRVNFQESGSPHSRIGMAAMVDFGNQSVSTMTLNEYHFWTDDKEFRAAVLHEFGHALGLMHEHLNPAANIQWNEQAVYDYFEAEGWTADDVKYNFFAKDPAAADTYTQWDSTSIMEYQILPQWTTNNLSVPENYDLSQQDKNFIATQYPNQDRDTGVLYAHNTNQVFNSQITFDPPYQITPNLVPAINYIDIPMNSDSTLRAECQSVTNQGMTAALTSWGGTNRNGAGMMWFESSATPGRSNFVTGIASGAGTQTIKFPTGAFTDPPRVVTWLNYIDETRGLDRTLSVSVLDNSITPTGFNMEIKSWGNTALNAVKASYVAYPASKLGVDSGTMSWGSGNSFMSGVGKPKYQLTDSGDRGSSTVNFQYGMFQVPPKVFVAISAFDLSGTAFSLAVKAEVTNVTATSVTITGSSWGGTTYNSFAVQWLAVAEQGQPSSSS